MHVKCKRPQELLTNMTQKRHNQIRLLILPGNFTSVMFQGGDKTDNRVLVLTPHRMFVMTAKVPSKIDQHYHYLDIQVRLLLELQAASLDN